MENLKICIYVIENCIKLLEENKINIINILMNNNLLYIRLDNNYYIITGMISYKKFIDIISNYYKVVLKYIPSLKNYLLKDNITNVYNKYNKVNINIENLKYIYKNIV